MDFGCAGEGGKTIGSGRGAIVIVAVGEAVCRSCVRGCPRIGLVGGFGGFARGFVEVPAEVADGGRAGVGPDAAALGDMLEDVDALVCKPVIA